MKTAPDNHFETYLLSCQESDENIVNVSIELEPEFAFRQKKKSVDQLICRSICTPTKMWKHFGLVLSVFIITCCPSLLCSISAGQLNRQRDGDWGHTGDHSWHQQICGCDYTTHKQPVCQTGFHSHIYINPASKSKWQCWLNKETTRMILQRQQQQTAQTDIWEAGRKTRPGTHIVFNSAANVTCHLPLDFKQNVIERKIH